jgi:hypothetical protein
MRMKLFAHCLPQLRVPCFLGVLLACGSVRAQSWDYKYSVARFQDPDTGYLISEIANFYEANASGDPLFTNALPVYAGLNPDISNPIWLDPGFILQIIDQPGGGLVVGVPLQVAGPPGGQFGHGGGLINKRLGTLTVTEVSPGLRAQFKPAAPPGAPFGPWRPVNVGDTFVRGCTRFDGPVSWTGCDVQLEPLASGQFSNVFAILGGGTNWPNSSVPSFFADKDWDLVYIGSSDSPFDGSGFGRANVLCDANAFMSVATPELYVGCVPEPSSLSLICIVALSLLARRHLKQGSVR